MSVKAVNPSLRKADHLSLAIADMVCAWIAIEYSYKLGQKMNLCKHVWFLQRQSHIRNDWRMSAGLGVQVNMTTYCCTQQENHNTYIEVEYLTAKFLNTDQCT